MGQRFLKVLNDLGIGVSALCDPHEGNLKLAKELAPNASVYTDPKALVSKHRAPLVIVASTALSHRQLVSLAAENGARYIVCEKPMATSLADAREMVQLCKKHGAALAVNHQMRFMPQYTRVKELMQSEAFGGLHTITVVAGNCGLTMNGSHYVEALRYLSDDEPAAVTAWLEDFGVPNPRGNEFVDQAGSWRIETRKGIRMYMDFSAQQGHGMHAMYAGRYGQIVVDELQGTLRAVVRKAVDRNLPLNRIGTEAEVIQEVIQPVDVITSTKSVITEFLAGRPVCSGEESIGIIAALVAAYVSNERGHARVSLREPLPEDRKFPWA
jgi:predicted dehydrogenase